MPIEKKIRQMVPGVGEQTMEKVVCPGCGAIYRVSLEKRENARLRARCKKCGASFLIAPPSTGSKAPPSETQTTSSPSEEKYSDKPQSPVYKAPTPDSTPDYVGIAVVIISLAALLFFGFMGFKTISRGDFFKPIENLADKLIQEISHSFSQKKPPSKRQVNKKYNRYKDVLALGHRHFNKKDFEKAIKYYTFAEKLQPQKIEPLYWQAQAFQKRGQIKLAIKKLEKIIEKDPKYVPAYNSLGWIYSQSRKWDKAITYLTQAIRLNPKNGWAYYNRGRCYFKLGQTKQALKDAKKACDLGFDLGCRVYKKYKK